ncbi:MAG TPA: branched-chain amino acid ABC transporter permease [Gaiellaceae bacterium]|nr:branched-chain amino acid ABC transporter permease [Gaiellaceae bacterium]
MADLLQQVVSGTATGGVYALLALALVLIYRSTGVVNFAQGEMAMFSTFVCWELLDRGVPYWGAFFLTLLISFAGGVAIERLVVRPVERAMALTVVTVTIGLLILLNGAAAWIWKGEQRTLENPFTNRTFDVGGVVIAAQDLGIIAVSLAIVLALWAFFQRTTLGLALRASAVNPDSSRLHGVRVSWMLALGWGLAALLGAVAGVLVAPTQGSFDQNLMLPILIYAFAAAVLGGLDSPVGAVVGGVVLGIALNLIGAYIDFLADLRLPSALFLILVVLLARPQGLFGREAVRRV